MEMTEYAGPPADADILIRGCDLVSMDDDGTVISDAAIAVSGGRITWIGKAEDTHGGRCSGEIMDGSGLIALPGMIDAHVHTAQQLLRGKLWEMSRTTQLRNPPWKNYYVPFEGILEPEDVHLSGLVAYTNMLSLGTTCFAEAGGPHPDEMARAAMETGIRGFVSLSTVDRSSEVGGRTVPSSMIMSTQDAYDRNIDLVERWRGGDRVQAWFSLRQIIVCSPELITALATVARREGVKIHTHLAEGTYEIDYALEHYGKRPTEYLDSLGVLGRHLHCAHSVILSPDEVDLYERHHVSACHCAMGNYGIGIPRLQEMWRRGIDIGLGTDGAAAAGSLDMFQVAHVARVGQQASVGHQFHTRVPMSAEELLKVATRGGARALGMDSLIGSVEVGKRADLVLVDKSGLDHIGSMDPLYVASTLIVGRDVRTVLVDGRVVVKDGEILTVDVDELRHRVKKRYPEIMSRFEQAVA